MRKSSCTTARTTARTASKPSKEMQTVQFCRLENTKHGKTFTGFKAKFNAAAAESDASRTAQPRRMPTPKPQPKPKPVPKPKPQPSAKPKPQPSAKPKTVSKGDGKAVQKKRTPSTRPPSTNPSKPEEHASPPHPDPSTMPPTTTRRQPQRGRRMAIADLIRITPKEDVSASTNPKGGAAKKKPANQAPENKNCGVKGGSKPDKPDNQHKKPAPADRAQTFRDRRARAERAHRLGWLLVGNDPDEVRRYADTVAPGCATMRRLGGGSTKPDDRGKGKQAQKSKDGCGTCNGNGGGKKDGGKQARKMCSLRWSDGSDDSGGARGNTTARGTAVSTQAKRTQSGSSKVRACAFSGYEEETAWSSKSGGVSHRMHIVVECRCGERSCETRRAS